MLPGIRWWQHFMKASAALALGLFWFCAACRLREVLWFLMVGKNPKKNNAARYLKVI